MKPIFGKNASADKKKLEADPNDRLLNSSQPSSLVSCMAPNSSDGPPVYNPRATAGARRALFPSVNRPNHVDPALLAGIPEPATEQTVFNKALTSLPLEDYDESATSIISEHHDRILPSSFLDAYLYPRLTRNERDRLTALWYYTRNIRNDRPFLAHIQETLTLLQDLIPHDCVILGFMEKDSYIRVATTNVPLAILPRREATCAHTINQPPGTVLTLTNMTEDRRFAQSPHVAEGGLVSYVGTALHYTVVGENGFKADIAFGSLCAASWDERKPMTTTQERTLLRFSKMIVRDIVERARSMRASEQHSMASRLADITRQVTAANVNEVVLGVLRETYPNARVSIQTRPDDSILLQGTEPVPYTHFHNYLYEDVAHIDSIILAYNHLPLSQHIATRTLRAIAINLSALPDCYLVVETAHLTHILDDIDVNFIHSCALILCNVFQAAELERITAAKTSFLRGVSHELRTPIHALLSSCELLVESVANARAAIVAEFSSGQTKSESAEQAELLANALASGRALLTTVNHLINFDMLGSVVPVSAPFSLAALEASLIADANASIAERGSGVELVCANTLPSDVHIINTDMDLLKQALVAILDNAITFTSSGTITLKTSLGSSDGTDSVRTLFYDVVDTGPGISGEEQETIFRPLTTGRRDAGEGIGLGLPVAARIAKALGGALELAESSPNGSRFRLSLSSPLLSAQSGHVSMRLSRSYLKTFAVPGGVDGIHIMAIRDFLSSIGMQDCGAEESTLLITMSSHSSTTSPGGTGLELVLNGRLSTTLRRAYDKIPKAEVATPTTSERIWNALRSILDQVDQMQDALRLSPQTTPPVSDSFLNRLDMYTPDPPTTRTRKALRVLVVDDNPTNLGILCLYSRRRRLPYLSAVNGAIAVDTFKNAVAEDQPVTLVLMDLQMPVMDGVEATRLIRMHEAQHGLPPCLILMVSGQSHDTDKIRATESGADGYYVKPLSMRTLDDLVNLHFPL